MSEQNESPMAQSKCKNPGMHKAECQCGPKPPSFADLQQKLNTLQVENERLKAEALTKSQQLEESEARELELRTAIEKAPHGLGCGQNGQFFSGDPARCRPSTCNCWKDKALSPNPRIKAIQEVLVAAKEWVEIEKLPLPDDFHSSDYGDYQAKVGSASRRLYTAVSNYLSLKGEE